MRLHRMLGYATRLAQPIVSHESSQSSIDVHVLLTRMPMVHKRFLGLAPLVNPSLFTSKGKGKGQYVLVKRLAQLDLVDPFDCLVDAIGLLPEFLKPSIDTHHGNVTQDLLALFHRPKQALHALQMLPRRSQNRLKLSSRPIVRQGRHNGRITKSLDVTAKGNHGKKRKWEMKHSFHG